MSYKWHTKFPYLPDTDAFHLDWYTAHAYLQRAIAEGPPLLQGSWSGHFPKHKAQEVRDKLTDLVQDAKLIWRGVHDPDDAFPQLDMSSPKGQYIWVDGACTILYGVDEYYGSVRATLRTTNHAYIHKFHEVLTSCIEPLEKARPKGLVHMLGSTAMGGMQLFNIGHAGVVLQRQNYSKGVLEAYDLLKKDLESKTPAGRLGVFTGPPGTGKTYLLRGMMEEVPGVFIIVPASMVKNLEDPDLVPTLLQLRQQHRNQALVLVLEDADAAMVKKTVENASVLSNMLNATSGILGDMIDLRVLSTTNAESHDIEPAVLREGRLSAHVRVDKLFAERAQRAYDALQTNEPYKFTAPAALAEVYALARERGWVPPASGPSIGVDASIPEPPRING